MTSNILQNFAGTVLSKGLSKAGDYFIPKIGDYASRFSDFLIQKGMPENLVEKGLDTVLNKLSSFSENTDEIGNYLIDKGQKYLSEKMNNKDNINKKMGTKITDTESERKIKREYNRMNPESTSFFESIPGIVDNIMRVSRSTKQPAVGTKEYFNKFGMNRVTIPKGVEMGMPIVKRTKDETLYTALSGNQFKLPPNIVKTLDKSNNSSQLITPTTNQFQIELPKKIVTQKTPKNKGIVYLNPPVKQKVSPKPEPEPKYLRTVQMRQRKPRNMQVNQKNVQPKQKPVLTSDNFVLFGDNNITPKSAPINNKDSGIVYLYPPTKPAPKPKPEPKQIQSRQRKPKNMQVNQTKQKPIVSSNNLVFFGDNKPTPKRKNLKFKSAI